MDFKQTVICCYRWRSLQWRKEACPMGIVREYTERRITWNTTSIALQDSFPMEGAEFRITLCRFPVSQFVIVCCITLQFPFNIAFALCSRADSYLQEQFLNAARVRTSKQWHASVICCLLVAFAWVHFVTNFHVCFSQNGNYERVQNFLARTSRNAVRDTDLNLTVSTKQIKLTFNSICAPMYTEFSWSLKSQCLQFKTRTFKLKTNLDQPHISIELLFWLYCIETWYFILN